MTLPINKFDSVSVDLGVMTAKDYPQELQNGWLVTGYLSFFGRYNVKFYSTVKADLGVMTINV